MNQLPAMPNISSFVTKSHSQMMIEYLKVLVRSTLSWLSSTVKIYHVRKQTNLRKRALTSWSPRRDLAKKTPFALEDILKPRDDGRPWPVRRVLVEGAPGVGKSVFAWHLCHKWAQKLENLDLVVLVQLRGKRAQEAKHF